MKKVQRKPVEEPEREIAPESLDTQEPPVTMSQDMRRILIEKAARVKSLLKLATKMSVLAVMDDGEAEFDLFDAMSAHTKIGPCTVFSLRHRKTGDEYNVMLQPNSIRDAYLELFQEARAQGVHVTAGPVRVIQGEKHPVFNQRPWIFEQQDGFDVRGMGI